MSVQRGLKSSIRTFAFLDMESTGSPHLEQNRTRIIELCIAFVSAEHVKFEEFPRVLNKLNFTFNPRRIIQREATDKTGLTNELLESQPEFQNNTVNIINQFLDLQLKPLCFVAHNGNVYHYPILKYEVSRVGIDLRSYLLCIDSYEACQDLYKKYVKEDNINIKLLDIYERLSSTTEYGRHRAESGVHTLIECATTLGKYFVTWANCKATKLINIPMMKPIPEQ